MSASPSLMLLIAASVAYAFGGLFMKQSEGASRPGPTIVFVLLFAGGALLQALAMKDREMGTSYVMVLGLEAVVAVVLSAYYLHEGYTTSRIAAVAMVIAGIAWLRST